MRKTEADEVILNFGLSAPTGDIDGTYLMPQRHGDEIPLPDASWSRNLGCPSRITYRYFFDRASIGVQGMCDLPMGFNDLGYRVGNEFRTNVWFDYLLDEDKKLAATFRVEGCGGTTTSVLTQLNPVGMPGNDPNMRGGEYMNFGYGLSYMLPANSVGWTSRRSLQ